MNSLPTPVKDTFNILFENDTERYAILKWIALSLRDSDKRLGSDLMISFKSDEQNMRKNLFMKFLTSLFDVANREKTTIFYGIVSCMEHFANFEGLQPSVLIIDDTLNWTCDMKNDEFKKNLKKFSKTNLIVLSP